MTSKDPTAPMGAYRKVFARITEVTFTPEDDQEHLLAVTVQWRGDENHCIKQGSMVWDETAGQWEYEPQPSSRDDALIARTRYPYDEAVRLAARLLNQQINPSDASGDSGASGGSSG